MPTLSISIVTLFIIGYLMIAIESVTKINKAAIALLMCVVCWTLFMFGVADYYPQFAGDTVLHKVSEVIASKKLVSHPVCMTAKGGISFEMEKYFSAVQPEAGMKAQRCLELNMNHSAVKTMIDLIGKDDEKAKTYAEIFYNQALLIAGLPIENPSDYADLVSSIM